MAQTMVSLGSSRTLKILGALLLFVCGWAIAGPILLRLDRSRFSRLVDEKGRLLPLVYDFGRVSAGEQVVHTFAIINPFGRALLVRRVIPACRCTVIDQFPGTILPGKSESLKLRLDVGPAGGRIEKTVAVLFADDSYLRITIEGDVVEQYPLDVVFDDFKRGQQPVRTAHVRPIGSDPIVIKDFRYDVKLLNAISTDGLQQSADGKIMIQARPDIPYGGFASAISFATNETSGSHPIITVRGYVFRPIEPKEKTLAFGIVSPGQMNTEEIVIYSPYDYPFHILRTEISALSPKFISVGSQRESNGEVRIPVSIRGGFDKKVLAGDITVTAIVNGRPEQSKVDFYAMSAASAPETRP